MNGHLGVRSGSSQKIRAYSTTRPFLEYHIRRRLRAMPNIAMLEAHDFVDVTTTAQRDRVTGVFTAQRGGNGVSQLPADLVVDGTGRGARTPVMLERLGYARPAEDNVTVHLKYSTQLLRLPPDALREMGFVVSPIPVGREGGPWPCASTAPTCAPFSAWQVTTRRTHSPKCLNSPGLSRRRTR